MAVLLRDGGEGGQTMFRVEYSTRKDRETGDVNAGTMFVIFAGSRYASVVEIPRLERRFSNMFGVETGRSEKKGTWTETAGITTRKVRNIRWGTLRWLIELIRYDMCF